MSGAGRSVTLHCLLVLCIRGRWAKDVNSLVQQANIYYEQPLRNGPPREFPLAVLEELPNKKDIKVIVHGFLGNRFHTSIRPLRHAYMAQGTDNVFSADWEQAAKLDYRTARGVVQGVGTILAQQLEAFLRKFDVPAGQVHLIGHSLGAHIAGNMGRYFNGTLGRVTGLDPALPLFSPGSPDSLHRDSALLVDVIHTDFPVFGDLTPRGTVDFYPNFGHSPQKGCDDDSLVTASKLIFNAYSCSHNRAVVLYAESIGLPRSFPSVPCTLNAIRRRTSSMCLQTLTKPVDSPGQSKALVAAAEEAPATQDQVVYLGEFVSKNASGVFFLETFGSPPYGKGVYTQLK